ncbi:MAG: TonB-dependent receptor plug domain-containing protein, partial [bacterium]|nr:TonB-dependent receptor plug domain-containing protein [Candidatus Colousia faecequi]
MKRLLILLATVMLAVQAYCQKIEINSGKCYKFRLTKEQMENLLGNEKTGCQQYMRDMVGVYDIDTFNVVKDTIEGLWAWVCQDRNVVHIKAFNNPPFEVKVGNDVIKNKRSSSMKRVLVRITKKPSIQCDVRDAEVRLTYKSGRIKHSRRMKWSERDGGFVLTVNNKAVEMMVEVKMDGYVRYVKMGEKYGYHYSYYAKNKLVTPLLSWGITDKNRYKPGETIKWKFVMLDKKGKPCKGDVFVELNADFVYIGKPDKYGVVTGETQLTDSFDLTNGRYYSLTATTDQNDEYRVSFRYEDYELKSLTVTGALEEREVVLGDTIKLRINAVDERGKEIMDGMAWGSWDVAGVDSFGGDMVRLSTKESKIDTVRIENGEVILKVPTAGLPKANMGISVRWNVRTAEGEERNGSEYAYCKHPSSRLNDTRSVDGNSAIKMSHIVNRETADSVGFSFDGHGEMFNWVIYRKGKEIASGRDTLLDWNVAESGMADYICVVDKNGERFSSEISHSSDMLKVSVEQRSSVKPGEEDEITVRVTDSKGRPVSDVDLTALAATSKLGYMPDEPDLTRRRSLYNYSLSAKGYDYKKYLQNLNDLRLAEMIEATGTQYWELTHAHSNVVTVQTPSTVKNQIVPVLVRNGEILPVSCVMINGRPFIIPGSSNRYVANSLYGANHISFHRADSVFNIVVPLHDTASFTKTWVAVPAGLCSAYKNSPQLEASLIYSFNNRVLNYEALGEGFIERDGELIPVDNVFNNVTGIGGVGVGAVNLDGVIRRENIQLGGRQVQLWHDPTVIQYDLSDKQNVFVSQMVMSLDDSLCTVDELRRNWIDRLDRMRRTEENIKEEMYRKGGYSVFVYLINNVGEKMPVQVSFRVNGSDEWCLRRANAQALYLPDGKDVELLFMYEGAVTRRLTINVGKDEMVWVRSSCRDGEGVVDKELEYQMRKLMEEIRAKRAQRYQVGISKCYPNNTGNIRIRGIGSVNSSTAPLYVVDGIVFDGDISSAIDPSDITSTSVLKSQEATSIYGSRGANGVILITTKAGKGARKQSKREPQLNMMKSANKSTMVGAMYAEMDGVEMEDAMAEELMVVAYGTSSRANTSVVMREDFSDAAFFVTDCKTDKEGRAVMKVKYPDDLTSWSEWFVAIKGRQRGVATSVVKAEKQHEAKLNMPRFAVEGDTVGAVGVGVDRVTGEHLSDTLHAVAVGDSLCMQFVYKTDGEKRCVKVYPQGLNMIEGSYQLMDSDATVTLAYKPEYGEMKVGVFGDAREMMMSSVGHVAEQDWCGSNDFMANRLRALRMLPKTEERSREIESIEKTLRKNRGANGMWCWWGKNSGSGSLWVTQRVLEAIGRDENENALEMELSIRRELNRGRWVELVDIARLFRTIGQVGTAIEIAKAIPDDSIKNTSLRIDKQMIEGREVRFDTMRHTTFTDGSFYSFRNGNSPWRCVTCEEVGTTLQAYRYFLDRDDREECRNIKRWLLQYGFKGFLSEYMEMQIVSTLWNGQPIAAEDVLWQMSVGGKVLGRLPYHTTVNSEVKVDYKGRRDVYISTEQNWWNKAPQAQGNGMAISTSYDKGIMTVEVTVEKTAENVIVSIPIPAGCSYADRQERGMSEMYREEYRDRVNIYCYQLREGKHTFKVRLNERYPGVYTINPAQVRLVDYPVFNANNEIHK